MHPRIVRSNFFTTPTVSFALINKWDRRFMELALHVAQWSKDPSTKVGAVIVRPDRRIVSIGYNGFPSGVCDHEERYAERAVKYKFVSHAERNALDNVSQDVKGCTLYSTLQPCPECAKSIIQKGIAEVVTIVDETRKELLDEFMNYSYIMFEEAKLGIYRYNDGTDKS
jgi:dCMP deaminase